MHKGTSNRKKWNAKETTLKVQEEPSLNIHDEPSAHEEYLILLQQKNRLVKQLKKKDEKQVELERREQGFSLYVNGPDNQQKKQVTAPTRRTKTAGTSRVQRLTKELNQLEAEQEASKYRSKTAPDRTRRKNWQAGSITLKTHRGEKIRIRAPDILTGDYEDDFEMESVNFAEQSESELSSSESSDSESEKEDTKEMPKGDRSSSKSQRVMQDGLNQEKEMLTLTIDDVKTLRRSLNKSIRESLAYCSSSSDSDRDADCPVQEEEEVVEEAVASSSSSSDDMALHPSKDNLIVLQLDNKKKAAKNEKRILEVPRKVGAQPYSESKPSPLESREHGSHGVQPLVSSTENRDIILKPGSMPRKSSRPLSASRKNKNPVKDSTIEAESVLAALRAENESVMSGLDTDRRHGTQSAPGRPQQRDDEVEEFDSDCESGGSRPATVSTGWKDRAGKERTVKPRTGKSVTTGQRGGESRECWPEKQQPEPAQNIDHIVQKVLQLDMKGQKRLLKALAHIEDGSAERSPASANSSKSRKKPLKATKPVNKMVRGESPRVADTVEIMIELLSSWGHPTRVGLTEIQFFDIQKQRIFVNQANVKVQGATSIRGELAALFNGKAKTTKDRNMWSCAFSNSRRVRLTVKLHSVEQGKPIELGKIKIWNYNKSLSDLKEGACHIRISIDSQVIFDGELDKGCGNQVFDYGMSVIVQESDQQPQNTDTTNSPPDSGIGTGSGSAAGSEVGGLGGTPSHIDNVLFHSEDFSDHSGSHPPVQPLNLPPPSPPVRSETRIMNHSTDRAISLPVVESTTSVSTPIRSSKMPEKHRVEKIRSRSHSRDPMEEESGIIRTPRSPAMRHKKLESQVSQEEDEEQLGSDNTAEMTPRRSSKKKERKSKMAARLNGSSSSVEFSVKDSIERQDLNRDDNSIQSGPSRVLTPHRHQRSLSDKERGSRSEYFHPTGSEHNQNSKHSKNLNKNNKDQDDLQRSSDSRLEHQREFAEENSANRRDFTHGNHGPRSRSTEVRSQVRPPLGRLSKEGILMSPRLHSPRRASRLSRSESLRESRKSSDLRESNSQQPRKHSSRVSRSESMRESRPSGDKLSKDLNRLASGKSSKSTERSPCGKSNQPVDSHPSTNPVTEADKLPDKKKSPGPCPNLEKGQRQKKSQVVSKSKKNDPKILQKGPDNSHIVKSSKDQRSSKQSSPNCNTQKQKKTDSNNGALEEKQAIGTTNGVPDISEPSVKADVDMKNNVKPVGEPCRLAAEETSFRSHSPYMSDEETCMMKEISKLTLNKKNFPVWLDNAGQIRDGSDDVIIEDDDGDDLLENWPKSGVSHLPTVLDDGLSNRNDRPASGKRTDRPVSGKCPQSGRRAESSLRQGDPPTHGRRSRQGQTTPRQSTPDQVADDGEEEVYRQQTSGQMANALPMEEVDIVPRMKQIESARAQWRKQEQNRLEESWSSLNVFERSHKGRLSVDMEKDVLDEYLNHEPQKPQQPTIEEELTVENDEEESFTIPELPKGREMVFNIKTTWGDRHYVGLNGIELFTSSGKPVKITKIYAEPSDINILPEYNKDPRVVTNLIDGVNRTRDDVHVWLAPYAMGQDHKIFMTFDQSHAIAMMRIWNYNKSRIHSYRGAKDIEITLDGDPIFKGEIARACGGVLGGSEAFGDTILFTMDEDILEEVSRHDTAFEADSLMDLDVDEGADRPATADCDTEERPFTCAARRGQVPPAQQNHVIKDIEDIEDQREGESFCGQDLRLNFTATWGDVYYLGLSGMEVVGKDSESLPLSMDMIDADPRDLHVLPGYEQDDRTLDKLINNVNITMSDENMWLIPFTEGEHHWLQIHFPEPVYISGLRFWNYNKSPEDTYRGAKIVHVTLDGKPMSPPEGYLIRKGPGNCYFDFAQEISFAQFTKSPPMPQLSDRTGIPKDSVNLDEEYEAAQVPCGFIYQFQLMSTWGDPYYIGLNGLEFYDLEGNLIRLTENNISAYPDSVNVLDGVEGDFRTPDKLINGVNATQDGKSMWLAPVLPGLLNKIYVIFDQPMQVSMIKLWNYSKTPNRGVKDFALLVDDLLVYNGILKQVVPIARGILPTCDIPQQYHTIFFSDDSELRRREKHTIILNQTGEQDVQLMNDHQVVNRYADHHSAQSSRVPDQALRPKTSMVDLSKGKRR